MSCLLPQFKCQPDTFCAHFKASNAHNQLSRSREILLRPQCSLSTATSLPPSATTTAVLEREKLQLPSIDADPGRFAAERRWTCLRVIETMAEENFEETLDPQTLTTSDEAVVATAGTGLLDLAKAASKVAKDAALLSVETQSKDASFALADNSQPKRILITEKEGANILEEGNSSQFSLKVCSDTKLTSEEIEFQDEMLSDKIAVRSGRKRERKARRARAAEKDAAKVVTVESRSNSQKKHTLVPKAECYPLHFLKRKTSISSLLNSSEEVKFSEGIQDLLKLEKLHEELAVRCGGQPTFAQWAAAARTDQKTLKERLNYGILCKEKMIRRNIRLVMSIAKKYQNAGLNLQDLVQEGCRGLLRGAEKFDSSKGFKFSTYAHWWIKQSVKRLLSDHSRTIRLPFHMVESTYKVKEARKRLYIENGRQPDNKEVAKAAGLSMKRLSAVLLTPKAPRSLDQKFGDDDKLKLSEVIADPNAETAEQKLIKQFMKQDLENVLGSLSPRENCVLRRRYGLENGRMNTLLEIGESMGVSRERIRQIELSAFRKLRSKRIKHLQQYLIS